MLSKNVDFITKQLYRTRYIPGIVHGIKQEAIFSAQPSKRGKTVATLMVIKRSMFKICSLRHRLFTGETV
jgi:hypothetical protein